jgi:Dolichyl-phosphate-mannose-protein mannosyltransferase
LRFGSKEKWYIGFLAAHAQPRPFEMKSADSDSQWLWNRGPVAAVAVYLVCAAWLGFQSPGMDNDEAVFLSGAVHVLNSRQEPSFTHDPWSWITVFGRHWPVMVLPYAGSLRCYLSLIPFALFGPNYYTARMVTTLAGAFGIWGLAVLVRSQVDAKAATMASLILAVNPAYLDLTIYDQGGVAEWMVPFGILSITLAGYLRSATASRAFWLGAAMGFGVWSRANIAWLLGAALLASAIVLGKRMFVPWRHLAALTGGGLIGGGLLLYYEIRSHGATFAFMRAMNNPQPMLHLVAFRLNLLSKIILSDSGHRDKWDGPDLPLWQTVPFSIMVIFALFACLRWGRASIKSGAIFGRVAALTFVFLLSCMLFSRLNISDHHLIALVPIAAVLVMVAARDICQRWRNARYAAGALAVLYLILALSLNHMAARQIRSTGGVGLWSNAIDSVSRYLQTHRPSRSVKVLDWGFQHNLFVLSNSKIASTELFWASSAEHSGSGKLWSNEIAPGDVFVLHAPGLVQFPGAGKGLLQALSTSGLPFHRIQFNQNNGQGYAEVVEIEASSR